MPQSAPPFRSQLTADEVRRYSRQLILPEIGPVGQRKLRNARVFIAGLGGLGSPLALYLAAAGVGLLGLLDSDVVEESNLQRQILHKNADLGRAKGESARAALLELNPRLDLLVFQERLRSANALELLRDLTL